MTLLLSVGFMNAQNAAPAKTAKVASATPKKQAPKLVVPAAVKAKIKLGNNRFYVNTIRGFIFQRLIYHLIFGQQFDIFPLKRIPLVDMRQVLVLSKA